MRALWIALVVIWSGTFGVPTADAQQELAQPVSSKQVYSLPRCLALAEANYPQVHEALAKLKHSRAQLSEARTAPFSEFTATGGLTLAPTVQGSPVYSPDSDAALTTDMGLAWQLGIEGIVPLWTFGKITSLWDAAEAKVDVDRYAVQKSKEEVKLNVKRAFYGVQLARDSLVLADEASERIDKYVVQLDAKVAAGEGDDIELIKLKMYRAELEARRSEGRREARVALSKLKFLTGVRGSFEIPDEPLRRVNHTLAPLTRYLEAARLFRPEVNMARAGVVAREAQVRLQRARYYPDIGLGLSAKWSRAPQVDDQRNPFARDPANYLNYGAGLVFRYKLDFLPQSARVAQAEAQLEEVRATQRFALGGVAVEVEEAYADAVQAAETLDAYARATQFAKRWLIKVQQGIEVGTFYEEDLVDPAKEYALKRLARMRAVFDYNVAIAKLAQVTGWHAVGAHSSRGP